MSQKKLSGTFLDKAITSDDILGKDVLDSEGEFLGVVEKLHINSSTLEILGITIDKGFLKSGLVIGKAYIKRVTPHAIFLKVTPAYKIKGMKVFDSEGKKLGTVSKVILQGNKNEVYELKVKAGVFRTLAVPKSVIKEIGYSVLLNITKKDLVSYKKQQKILFQISA